MRRVFLLTLGCPKNAVASDRIEQELSRAGIGLTDDPRSAEAFIVNTCGFIEAAAEESIEHILEFVNEKNGSDRKVIAVGCLAQRYGEELAKAIPELDGCLGLSETGRLAELLGPPGAPIEPAAVHKTPYGYVEISTGCDQKCSFCVLPEIHGPFQSVPQRELIERASALTAGGAKELVLIGQETGSYGTDLDPKTSLDSLFRRLDAETDAAWIRVMYLQWHKASEALMESIGTLAGACQYLDIPVQHASAPILRAMSRAGDAESYLRLVRRWRDALPDLALRTSVIVGFPGETEDQVFELGDFLREAEFDYVGVFEFSPEEGTPAAALPGLISPAEKRERAEQIRLLADDISRTRRGRWQNRVVDVLVEGHEGALLKGRARFQAPEVDGEIVFSGAAKPGSIVSVRLTDTEDYVLKGEAVDV